MAKAETPLADRPNVGATAAGALPSTSSCRRTSRQRAGSRPKALVTRRASSRASACASAALAVPGLIRLDLPVSSSAWMSRSSDHSQATPGPLPVVGHITHRGKQVPAERMARAAALADNG
jgi:hypothetical protein